MVTAILPAVAGSPNKPTGQLRHSRVIQIFGNTTHISSPSIASESTITPERFLSRASQRQNGRNKSEGDSQLASSTSKIAGFVGMGAGTGALIALGLFLPLPAKFQYAGVGQKAALKYSFYVVAAVAFVLALCCLFGLGNLQTQVEASQVKDSDDQQRKSRLPSISDIRQMMENFKVAIIVGFERSEIAIGYLGGFVARASSVAISLFIPLLVNATFHNSGLCNVDGNEHDPNGLPDIKKRCPRAYVVAAELTGVSQMIALICAPLFGYWCARVSRKQIPLLFASISGIVGYPLFANVFHPRNSTAAALFVDFFAVSLIGVSQIGAIVCSLGTLSTGVLLENPRTTKRTSIVDANGDNTEANEGQPLLPSGRQNNKSSSLSTLKGSVAGVYSLYGGLAILILTKVGGLLFDKVSLTAPFYIMAAFNAVLMVACLVQSLLGVNSNHV